jgi:succinate dehydrogenase / fumarate reductase flavoprotein subunit
LGEDVIRERYGNLFEMYEKITGENAYRTPMRIYPAPHYAMGGLWVDYHLMSTIPGLFVLGEANFSDHGANRLGASALMQGLADGNFIATATVPAGLAGQPPPPLDHEHAACQEAVATVAARIAALRASSGSQAPATGRPVDAFHRALGLLMIDACGISRHADGLQRALTELEVLRAEFAEAVIVPDHGSGIDTELEKALRLEDFLGLAELMLRDALAREESCGAHFREEHRTPEGEARRDDERFAHIAAWEHRPEGAPRRHAEPLHFRAVPPSARSYR